MSHDRSLTWANHVKQLFLLYDLPDPLLLLSQPAWSKDRWKNFFTAKVVSHHEKSLREKAASNSKMSWFNVNLHGLTGHSISLPLGRWSRILCGDYLTMDRLVYDRQSGNPCCQLCPSAVQDPTETLPHLLTECKGTALIRENVFPELLTIINQADSDHPILHTPLSLHKEDHTPSIFLRVGG